MLYVPSSRFRIFKNSQSTTWNFQKEKKKHVPSKHWILWYLGGASIFGTFFFLFLFSFSFKNMYGWNIGPIFFWCHIWYRTAVSWIFVSPKLMYTQQAHIMSTKTIFFSPKKLAPPETFLSRWFQNYFYAPKLFMKHLRCCRRVLIKYWPGKSAVWHQAQNRKKTLIFKIYSKNQFFFFFWGKFNKSHILTNSLFFFCFY